MFSNWISSPEASTQLYNCCLKWLKTNWLLLNLRFFQLREIISVETQNRHRHIDMLYVWRSCYIFVGSNEKSCERSVNRRDWNGLCEQLEYHYIMNDTLQFHIFHSAFIKQSSQRRKHEKSFFVQVVAANCDRWKISEGLPTVNFISK